MKKDGLISIVAILVAGIAAFMMFPRQDTRTSPVLPLPEMEQRMILGETEDLETLPDEPQYTAIATVQAFLSAWIPQTQSLAIAREQLTSETSATISNEPHAFIEDVLEKLELSARPTSYRILNTTQVSATEVHVTTEFQLPSDRVVRAIPTVLSDNEWQVSLQ